MESKGRYYFDIEATNLLDDKSVDYTASPWKLKDNFKIHCIVATDIDTLETFEFVQKDVYTKFKQWAIDNVNEIISHNGINYDMLVCKVALGMPYTICPDTWCGKPVVIHDTLVLSKVLNPDRRGHSIEYFGQILGFPKIDWRSKAIELGLIDKQAERGAEFSTYHPEMLVYCKQDVLVGCKTFHYLMKEWGDWKWQEAYDLEKAVAEIITRQSHRGFWFDMDLAKSNIAELDQLMQERKERVEPNLPQKPMGVTKLKQYMPPKEQFLKNGKPNSFIQKWAEKHGGSVIEEEGKYLTTLYGKKYILPIEQKPIVTHEPAAIDDTTFIKEVLVGAGWQPTQYKEKDLTVDTKKQKLSLEKYAATVERYVTQTLSSAFCKDRCDKLGTSPARLKDKLLRHDLNKPLKVFTNPTFTVGQEKEIDPALESLADSFPYVRDIIEYLTYKHRRNSILGGGMDVFEDDEDDFETGFIPNVRTDGRIPTPADSCGCATGRMKHKGVANIPRVTSLYGANMRALFGVSPDDPTIQFAYDFASLEARIEADYCWRYDQTKEYCNSLIQEKPHDVHCYSEDTLILTECGWKSFGELSYLDKVAQWDDGIISFTHPENIIWQDYSGDMIKIKGKLVSQLVTPNHRVVYTTDKINKYRTILAEELLSISQAFIPAGGVYDGHGVSVNDVILSLVVATQADGHLCKDSSAISFSFSKVRKIERMKSLLHNGGIQYSEIKCSTPGREDEVTIRLLASPVTKEIRSWLNKDKSLSTRLYSLSKKQMELVIDEVKYWDGTIRKDGAVVLDTTCKSSRDILYTINQIIGRMSYCSSYLKKGTYNGAVQIHRLYLTKDKAPKYGTSGIVTREPYSGKIGCVSVPSGYVVTKKDDCIVVSGNTVLARKIEEMIGQTFTRNSAKSVKYASTYGAQAYRIAKTVGCDEATGQAIFDAFWEAAKPLAMLKENVLKWWQTKGDKKFIPGLDGRKINTRSQHALLNSLFQSAGVICAKRVMVVQDRLYAEAGIGVDFWTEDWKNKEYIQQMIAYHDEAQYEVTKNLVKWKSFTDKEQAKQWLKDNPQHVGIVESRGKYFVAQSIVSDIAFKAVQITNEYYKLNVPLAIDPQYGRSWCECH